MIILLLAAAPVIYFVRSKKLAWLLALLVLAGAGTLWVYDISTLRVGAITLSMDSLGQALSLLAVGLSMLVVLYTGPTMSSTYYTLILIMVGAITGLASTTDVFNLWVWFEVMTISTFLLVAFHREQPTALEAGFKYLVQSVIGSAFILLGIALDGSGGVATALFIVGFGIKIALVPLHTWLPDAHSQAPAGISALLSGVVIEAALIALLRVLSQVDVLLGFAVLNLVVGNLLALRQEQIKRMLAYSSLVHVGYMLLGVGIGTTAGLRGATFHLIAHGMMKSLAFLAAGVLMHHIAHGHPLTRAHLRGAAAHYPVAAFALSVGVLGLGGLPPLAGFISKWQIFTAGLPLSLLIIGGLSSVLSLGYYAPVVMQLYRRPTQPSTGEAVPAWSIAPLVVLLVVIVGMGLYPLFQMDVVRILVGGAW